MAEHEAVLPKGISRPPVSQVDVVAPNFKQRLSGVTSTIVQLIPLQRADGLRIATLGPGLPDDLPKIGYSSVFGFWKKPVHKPFRIWHARRNTEMVAGIIMRDVLRMKLRLVFTSAAQRDHQPFTKSLIRRMDAVIATSERSGRFLDVPYTTILHGIDLERFHPPVASDADGLEPRLAGQYIVGCSGRVRHQKGTDLFVDAMIALLPSHPQWTAVITGRTTAEHKSFEDDLRLRVEQAGLSDRILFLGEVPDVRIWYRRMTLYVAPSRNEGFGLTPLEAMASRTAVVASDAGAYLELIVPGETGDVVPAGDGEALTRAIKPYLDDPAMTLQSGEKGLAYVREHFPLQKEASKIRQVYEKVWAKG